MPEINTDWNVNTSGMTTPISGTDTNTTVYTSTPRPGARDTFGKTDSSMGASTPSIAENPTLPLPNPTAPFLQTPRKEEPPLPQSPGKAILIDYTMDTKFVRILKDAINNPLSPLTKEEKGEALFAFYIKDQPVSQKIREALATAVKTAKENIAKENPNWVPSEPESEVFDSAFDQAVQSALGKAQSNLSEKEQPLSDKQLMNLEYALYHPENASTEAKELLNQLGIPQLIKKNLEGMQLGVPGSWRPNSSEFDKRLNSLGDTKFETAVDAYVKEHNLSAEESYQLKTAYYHPDAGLTNPLSGKLIPAYNLLMKKMQGDMPKGWDPSPDVKLWDGMINVNLRYVNEENLSKYMADHPKLTGQDEQLIRNAMNGDTNSAIPKNLSDAAAAIKAASFSEISGKYGLSTGFIPSGLSIDKVPTENAARNAANTVNGMKTVISNYAKNLPDGPGKVLVMDFLKIISDALKDLQEMIYKMEVQEAEGQKTLSSAQQEAMQFKIDQHMKALEEQKAKEAEMQKKQGTMSDINKVMKILGPILIAVTVLATIASFGTLGPLAVGVILALTAISCIDMIPGVDGKVAAWTMGIAGSILRECGVDEKTCRYVDFAVKLAIVISLAVATSGAGAATAITTSTQFFTASNLITDVLVGAGVDPMTTAIAAGAVNAAVSMAALGAALALTAKNSAKVSTQLLEAAEKYAKAASDTSSKVMKFMYTFMELFCRNAAALAKSGNLTKYLNIGIGGLRATNSAMEATNGGIEYTINQTMGELADLKKRYESKDVQLRDVISALKEQAKLMEQVIQNLMAMLAGVGKTQVDNWDKNRTPQIPI